MYPLGGAPVNVPIIMLLPARVGEDWWLDIVEIFGIIEHLREKLSYKNLNIPEAPLSPARFYSSIVLFDPNHVR